jgi:LysR family hydrogen peroxide-inducible transcriptional activator
MVAVARTGNFSRAAEQCHVSQPSLSQQIQKLEDELGSPVFERMKRQTKLTSVGEAFLPRAMRILDEVATAEREARDARDSMSGTVTVGVLPTIAPYVLPAVMSEFTRKFPGVEVIVQEDTTAQLSRLLIAYEIDIALVSLPIGDVRLETQELFTEELLLALPPKHRLVRQKTVSLASLKNERLIVMKEGHCLGDQVLGFCDRGDLKPNISFRSAQLETVQSLVHAGLGISLIPKMATKPRQRKSPQYRSLSPPRPSRKIVAAWFRHRPPNRVASEFLSLVARRLSSATE